MNIVAGEFRLYLGAKLLCCGSVVGISNLQPDVLVLRHAAETLVDVLLNSIDHHGFALRGGSGLCKGIQLFTLNGQHRLQAKHCTDGCGRRSDPSAFFQIIQGVQHNIDTAVEFIIFQEFFDLGRVFTGCCKLQGIQRRLTLGYRPLLIGMCTISSYSCKSLSHRLVTLSGDGWLVAILAPDFSFS